MGCGEEHKAESEISCATSTLKKEATQNVDRERLTINQI
jgi:hypothetical protein